jgi:DNA recombination protein RmuC
MLILLSSIITFIVCALLIFISLYISKALNKKMSEHFIELNQGQLQINMQNLSTIQSFLANNTADLDRQLHDALTRHNDSLNKQFDKLTLSTEFKLDKISLQLDKRLESSLERNNDTFTNIIKRLTIIDEAQKKISDLSTSVLNLQDILNDKRARGAFGEFQLHQLMSNILPSSVYELQAILPNQTRVDCLLSLPEPNSKLAIDAKFPLENYKIMINPSLSLAEKQAALLKFKQDIKKHITDISSKYILPGFTCDNALMFIPAESVFAEIHANHEELVQFAFDKRVWLTSPTTLMAILTTANSVIKDQKTRQQVHLIQDHLRLLSKDFDRFGKRMADLTKHIQQAHQDAEDVHVSAKKITSRFTKIDKVELDKPSDKLSPHPSEVAILP